ncbi:MAG: ABC transporter ATP-binding protein [Deltaproteobacteria bacterium CG03_land_8_20_14_0_80_45_14]|nr:MAG: ABC transporter ATP-binding protein [Deltaproteobacteria bacterium CG03_land_8_20_14_0_80_45_14]
MSLIEIKTLNKAYESGDECVQALVDVDLNIERGEFISVMGPSGSGKSTLLTILGGLNHPTKGDVVIDDIPVYKLSLEKLADFRREYLGFIFQSFQLIPYLTVIENVMLPLSITEKSNKEQMKMAEGILERIGLKGKGKRLPDQLSGGEQERVAIARALVNSPPILMADEPTGNLDSKTGKEIMDLFKSLNEEGQTIIMVTHNPENMAFSTRTLFLKDGRVENNGANELIGIFSVRGSKQVGTTP